MNAAEILKQITPKFESDLPELDAQVILAHVMGRPRSWLLAHLETPLTPLEIAQTEEAVSQYQVGTPLPYIVGHWEFYGLDLDITKDVLIPRPETELLVEKAVTWLKASPERRTVADIGTGSGAIAVALAMHVPDARILATDISYEALKVAKHNAEKFHVHHKIEFLQCDILPQHVGQISTEGHFDLICANLPYIPTDTLHNLPIYGNEPTLALDGGADGLDLYRHLLKLAPDWLAPNGKILLEIEATQGVKALGLAYDFFNNMNIQLHQDLAGHDRILEITPIPD